MELVYGLHAVEALLRHNPGDVEVLFAQAGRVDKRMGAVVGLARNQGIEVVELGRYELDAKVEGRHQGVVARLSEKASGDVSGGAGPRDEHGLLRRLDAREQPVLLLVLDGVTDPHNLGACLRSAAAAGADAVVAPRDRSADITPTVRKVACGAAETLPFVRVTNLARTLGAIRERGIWVYGMAAEAEQLLHDSDLRGDIALVMGAEGRGLRRLTREACDVLLRLPMAPGMDSLNVSVAAGICLFEAVRQKRLR